MVKVTYEFDSIEDEQDLKILRYSGDFYFALDKIYNLVRNELKHGTEEHSEHTSDLLESIRHIAHVVHEADGV